jgi:hypothetical protein
MNSSINQTDQLIINDEFRRVLNQLIDFVIYQSKLNKSRVFQISESDIFQKFPSLTADEVLRALNQLVDLKGLDFWLREKEKRGDGYSLSKAVAMPEHLRGKSFDIRLTLNHDLLLQIKNQLQAIDNKTTDQQTKMPQKIQGGSKRRILWRGDGKIEYNKKEYFMRKNANYAILSQKIYTVCRQVGDSIPASELYRLLPDCTTYSARDGEWRKLNHNIDTANDWAKRNGLPKLFKCIKHEVIRLK